MTKQSKPPRPKGTIQLGENANRLLNDHAFKSALEAVRGTYTQEMINSKPEEKDKREHLHRCIHALSDIETALTAFVQSGKLEMSMANRQEKVKK